MTPAQLRVAAIQATSVAGDVEANVAAAVGWVKQAATTGATLAVLPELYLPGYDPRTLREHPDACDVTAADDRLAPLAGAAAACGVAVLVGASVRDQQELRRLALVSVSTAGDVNLAYSKQHLWDAERELFTPGTEGTSVQLGEWQLGLGVCYDGCFPEHGRAAADAGAYAYVCPSAYVVGSEHRRDLYYAARALDNGFYVVFAGLAGRCGEHEFSGGTAIYDPQGRRVASVESLTGIAVADLDIEVIAEARRINPYDRDRPASLGGRTVLSLD
ncbi:MAG: carbon-nitrogen hydrolase family protein [Nocardioidaceae bacterium]